MNEDRYGLFPINNNSNSDFDVIFIHGLGGDKYTTWKNTNGESWQNWLAEDYNASIWTIGYGANKTNWIEEDMSLDNAALNILSSLKSNNIGKKPYILIVHSLGGLLAKKILLKAQNHIDYLGIFSMCKSIVFFAVPHSGSKWAGLARLTSPISRTSKVLESLPKDTPYLHELATNFNAMIVKEKIETYVFYETKRLRASGFWNVIFLANGIMVVNQESATNVHTDNPYVPIHDDHISICKFKSRNSAIYQTNVKPIMNKMIEITTNMKKDTEESKKIERESEQASRFNINGDYINGDKHVHDRSVTVGGSNKGTIVTGDNNIIK